MLAAVAANYFGISYKEIMQADVKLQLPRLRLENKFINGVHFILDCYNASLASFKAAFSSIFDLKNSRKIGLFGYMGELGQFSAICHEEVATEALKLFDILVVIGKDCQPMLSIWQAAGKEIYLYNNKDDVLPKLKQILQKGDLVLVKGSRINKLEDIIAAYESSL